MFLKSKSEKLYVEIFPSKPRAPSDKHHKASKSSPGKAMGVIELPYNPNPVRSNKRRVSKGGSSSKQPHEEDKPLIFDDREQPTSAKGRADKAKVDAILAKMDKEQGLDPSTRAARVEGAKEAMKEPPQYNLLNPRAEDVLGGKGSR